MAEAARAKKPGEKQAEQAIPLLVLIIWILAVAELVTGWRWPITIAAAMAAMIALWGAIVRGGFPRFAVIVFGGIGTLLIWRVGAWGDGLVGLERAARLTAFVTCLHGLRSIVQTAPRLAEVQDSLVAFRLQARRGAMQLLSFAFSVPLAIGAVSVIAPFLTRERDAETRQDLAVWGMRGMGIAIFFSPFTVAMGVAVAALPEVNLPLLMGMGFALALAVLAFPFLIGQCALPRQLTPRFWGALGAVLLPIVVIVVVNIATILTLGLTTVQSAIVVVPSSALVIALLAEVAGDRRTSGRGMAMFRLVRQVAVNFDMESAVFVAAMWFAAAITATPEVGQFVALLTPYLGPGAMIAVTLIVMISVVSAGVHMMVPMTVLLTLFGPHMPDPLHLALLALAGLIGWAFGALAAMGSISFLVCAKLFEVSARQLAYGTNLRLMLAIVALYSLGVLLLA